MFLRSSLVEIDLVGQRSWGLIFVRKTAGNRVKAAQPPQEQSPADAYDPTKMLPQTGKDTAGESAKALAMG